ncbi:MAG: nucleotidyltransferase family protein [Candidatus Borkfalkiaceae bacterium]|nr:nucleotidyltransferase family protein [Christensenellaceae bacterium]
MQAVLKTMTDCIAREICGRKEQPFLPQSSSAEEKEKYFSSLLRFSDRFDLAHLVGSALSKDGLLPAGKVAEQFRKRLFTALYRCENLTADLESLGKTLAENGIDYLPLKGAVLRAEYPEPWMRTSCDIDVLVREEDAEKAKEVLTGRGYRFEGKGTHDLSFFSPSEVHIELHYGLIESDTVGKADLPLRAVWENAVKKGEGREYAMTEEFFYYYHVAHTAKHLVHGGCGVRPLIDLWILNHGGKTDGAKRDALLREGGLSAFAEAATRLSETWFGGEEGDERTDLLGEFVLKGGVYGSTSNRVAVSQDRKGGKLGYALSRIFLPYGSLVCRYPSLEKHKWLLPVYEARRWFSLLFSGGAKRGMNELALNARMTKEEREKTKKMLSSVGLDF